MMDSATQELILDVMDGNPGALTIINRLMYFTTWPLLLLHLKDRGLTGSSLWKVVQDDYGQDWTQFATDQLAQIQGGRVPTAPGAESHLSPHYN